MARKQISFCTRNKTGTNNWSWNRTKKTSKLTEIADLKSMKFLSERWNECDIIYRKTESERKQKEIQIIAEPLNIEKSSDHFWER